MFISVFFLEIGREIFYAVLFGKHFSRFVKERRGFIRAYRKGCAENIVSARLCGGSRDIHTVSHTDFAAFATLPFVFSAFCERKKGFGQVVALDV